MSFEVGDKVVYPHHGAAVIAKRETVVSFGEEREYLVLNIAHGNLTLKVPVDNTDEVGLREVVSREELEEVYEVLRKTGARTPSNWSRRFKNHLEKLKSGDIYQVAEVVRNLTVRDRERPLSAGEKRMLLNARRVLVSEMTFALDISDEEAEAQLDAILDEAVAQVVPAGDAPVDDDELDDDLLVDDSVGVSGPTPPSA